MKTIFSVRSLSSGCYDYEDNKLVYAPGMDWVAETGYVKFANPNIIVGFVLKGDTQRVEIPYRIVEAMIIGSRHATFTLTLWEAPRFFRVANTRIEDRITIFSLGQNNHAATPSRVRLVQLANGSVSQSKTLTQLLVYHICVSPVDFDAMLKRLYERAVLTLHYHDVLMPPAYERKSLVQGIRNLKATIATFSRSIPFEVLYQMGALAWNGFLLLWTVQRVLELLKTYQEQVQYPSPSTTARAIKKLFSQIPFPGPDTDQSVFDAREIWKYIQDNERSTQDISVEERVSVSQEAPQTDECSSVTGKGPFKPHNDTPSGRHSDRSHPPWP